MDNSKLIPNAPAEQASEEASGAVDRSCTTGTPWVVHIGPFSVGSDGLVLKPQFKMGGQIGCFNADYGIGDLREGFSLDASVKAKTEAEISGQCIDELHAGIKKALIDKAAMAGVSLDAGALGTALDTVGGMLNTSASTGTSQIGRIATACGINIEDFKRALEDTSPPSPMVLKVTAFTGFGINMKLAVGLLDDLEGYRMVGVANKMAVGVAVGGDVFAGRHSSGTSVKIMIGIGNFGFEYTLPVKVDAQQDVAASTSNAVAGVAVSSS